MLVVKLVFPFFQENRVIGVIVLGLYLIGVLITGIRAVLVYLDERKK